MHAIISVFFSLFYFLKHVPFRRLFLSSFLSRSQNCSPFFCVPDKKHGGDRSKWDRKTLFLFIINHPSTFLAIPSLWLAIITFSLELTNFDIRNYSLCWQDNRPAVGSREMRDVSVLFGSASFIWSNNYWWRKTNDSFFQSTTFVFSFSSPKWVNWLVFCPDEQ